MTRSETAAVVACGIFDIAVRTGFWVMQVMRRPSAEPVLTGCEEQLAAIRPRSGLSCGVELELLPDELDASILIPAYNAEAYLAECVDSALLQDTVFRYEIIVVDDGSTDETRSILHEYRNCDKVSVIRVANEGVASARNRAITRARGKYLMFLDSDDRLERNSVELLIGAAVSTQADIVQGGYLVIDGVGKVTGDVRYDSFTSGVPPAGRHLSGYPWGKAIRKSMFETVRFPDGMDFEDTIFSLLLFPLCGRYTTLSEPVYNYRDNPDGITRKVLRSASALDAFWIVSVLLEQRKRLGIPVDERLLDTVEFQFGELLWLRLAGQDPRVLRMVFSAACVVVNAIRDQVGTNRQGAESQYLDHAFAAHRYDLWAYACRFGLP
ncbi:glycosyltransferase family 2 protein [Mycobacterium sp. C31M]